MSRTVPAQIQAGQSCYRRIILDGEDCYQIEGHPQVWVLGVSEEYKGTLFFTNRATRQAVWVLPEVDEETGQEKVQQEEVRMIPSGKVPSAKNEIEQRDPLLLSTSSGKEPSSAKEKLERWRAERKAKLNLSNTGMTTSAPIVQNSSPIVPFDIPRDLQEDHTSEVKGTSDKEDAFSKAKTLVLKEKTNQLAQEALLLQKKQRLAAQVLEQEQMREQLAQKRRNMEELRVQLEQKRIDALRAKVEKDTEIIQQEKEKPTTDLFMEECSALEKVSDTQKQSLDKKMKLFDQLNSKRFSADNFPEERDDTLSSRRNRTVSFSDDPFSHLDKTPKAQEKEAPSTIKDGSLHYGNAFLYLGELICPPGTTTFLSQHPSVAVGKELEQDELLRYQREGRGALYTVDASGRRLLHDGEWKGDRKEGKGRTTLPTGAHLEGKWSADRVTGTAKFRGENGLRGMLHTNTEGKDALMCSLDRESIRFVGEADLHLDPTTESGEACTLGSGVYQLKSAAYVEWITKEGKAGSGTCRVELPNGDTYVGMVEDSRFHGKGHYTFTNGVTYSGEFTRGHWTGKGVFQLADGNLYKGEVEEGLYHGVGCYLEKGSYLYEGGWRQGEMHGRGILIFSDGTQWEGVFANGERKKGRYVAPSAQ